jgi:hypothetical protein
MSFKLNAQQLGSGAVSRGAALMQHITKLQSMLGASNAGAGSPYLSAGLAKGSSVVGQKRNNSNIDGMMRGGDNSSKEGKNS